MEFTKPSLTEYNTKFHIRNSLRESRVFKDKHITILVNIFLFLLLVGVISGLLYYKYKGKPSPEDKRLKDQQQITNLPLL